MGASSVPAPLQPALVADDAANYSVVSTEFESDSDLELLLHFVNSAKGSSAPGSSDQTVMATNEPSEIAQHVVAKEMNHQVVVPAKAATGGAGGSKANPAKRKKTTAPAAGCCREFQRNHADGSVEIDWCLEFQPMSSGDYYDECVVCHCCRNCHLPEVDEEGATPCTDNTKPRSKRPAIQPTSVAHSASNIMPFAAFITQDNELAMVKAMIDNLPRTDRYEPGCGVRATLEAASDTPGVAQLALPPPTTGVRTKFSKKQKKQMRAFAEKIGWRMRKHDDEDVKNFCESVGVKRHALKMWLLNNKHNHAKINP